MCSVQDPSNRVYIHHCRTNQLGLGLGLGWVSGGGALVDTELNATSSNKEIRRDKKVKSKKWERLGPGLFHYFISFSVQTERRFVLQIS